MVLLRNPSVRLLTVDHSELSMASWFNREDIPDEGDNISLTKEMMMAFKHGKA